MMAVELISLIKFEMGIKFGGISFSSLDAA